jgi:flagellar motor switch protein FliN/FliY
MSETEATSTDLEGAIDEAAEAVEVQTRELEELEPASPDDAPMGLDHLLDVPVQIAVEVGRTRLTLADLVKRGPGSVLELDREAHEPADVLVNGKVVARGEIVTVGDHYGVRITSVLKG